MRRSESPVTKSSLISDFRELGLSKGDTVLVRIKEQQGSMERPRRDTRVELITDSGVITAMGNEVHGIEVPFQ